MSHSYWRALLAAGALFIAGASEAEQPPPTGEEAQRHAASDAGDTHRIAHAAFTPSPDLGGQPAAADERNRRNQKRDAEADGRAQADLDAQRFMAAIALFQLVLSAVGAWLIWQTLRATRNAVKEANGSAKAAALAVQVAKDSAQKQLRAYVVITGFSLVPGPAVSPCIQVRFRNAGVTPAKSVHSASRLDVYPGDLAGPRPYDFADAQTAEVDIGPGVERSMSVWLGIAQLTERDAGTVFPGRLRLAAHGEIRYLDVFDQPHFTKFHIELHGMLDGGHNLHLHRQGNESD